MSIFNDWTFIPEDWQWVEDNIKLECQKRPSCFAFLSVRESREDKEEDNNAGHEL